MKIEQTPITKGEMPIHKSGMKPKITTFLTFDGKAEEAMNFYISLFESSTITSIKHYGSGEAGAEGSVMSATFTLNEEQFMCIDSSVKHDWDFTPAISLFVNCDTKEEVDELFSKLSQGGSACLCRSTSIHSAKDMLGLPTSTVCRGN